MRLLGEHIGMDILNANSVFTKLSELNSKRGYKAMYSSLYGGIVVDPALMLVPIDEHMVHRGDGVFEAIRFTPKKIYLLGEHLQRLARSAEWLALKLPLDLEKIESVCRELRDISKLQEGLLRIFVGRGPGDFSPNPYTTLGSQLYVVVTAFQPPAMELYEKGARLAVVDVPIKPGFYAQVKSCNYLPNVMMKKMAVDSGVDFCINLNEDGFVAEGPTENIAMVDSSGILCAPKFDYTLRGTTLVRAFELAEKKKFFKKIEIRDIRTEELKKAREVMMIGTTLGVLPVTLFDGLPVAGGRVGEGARRLRAAVAEDMFG